MPAAPDRRPSPGALERLCVQARYQARGEVHGFYATAKRQRDGAGPEFRPILKVTTRDLDDALEVRVRDNGTGIAPEIRDKLFQPFVTTKPTGEGTGLGLSIAYDIVTQQHGGTIEVDSVPGEFTEFTIRLLRQ